jgi:hypothetical protein
MRAREQARNPSSLPEFWEKNQNIKNFMLEILI